METKTYTLRLSDELRAALTAWAAQSEHDVAWLIRRILTAAVYERQHDPRTPQERAQDDFAAEVLDTQASDRPC